MMTPARITGILRKMSHFAKREVLHRSLPHGLVSPRYFLPFQPRRVRIHRRLWLSGLPRMPLAVYLFMEGSLYLRLVLFSAWRFSFRAVRHWGPGIRDREGLGFVTQILRVLSMAIRHAIPPSEIYAFRLYGPDRHARVWDYVFTHEVAAFHRRRDLINGKKGAAARILGDKEHTAEILSRHGIPVVPTLDFLNPGADIDLSHWLKSCPRLFLKPRHGSAGRGCFVVEKGDNGSGFSVFETRAGMVTKRVPKVRLFEFMAREPYLVQPLVPNHPDLAGLCETRDAVTVRIITEAPEEKPIRCYAAMLEIPGPLKDAETGKKLSPDSRFHIILPIDPARGETVAWDAGGLPSATQKTYGEWYKRAENRDIPFWSRMRQNAIASHELFRDIYAVAWDFAITGKGPYLFEGNTGWGTRMPQMVHGGLLRDLH